MPDRLRGLPPAGPQHRAVTEERCQGKAEADPQHAQHVAPVRPDRVRRAAVPSDCWAAPSMPRLRRWVRQGWKLNGRDATL
jgi:hypothetical protein